MANFKTHITIGTIGSITMGVVCWKHGLFTRVSYLLAAVTLSIVGSILPDIDAEKSIPTKIINYSLSFLSVGGLLAIINLHNYSIDIFIQAVLCVCLYFLVKYLFPKLLSFITCHRGIIHSIPMAILISIVLLVYLLKNDYDFSTAFLLSSFLGGGFILHLILDELYSVNIFGVRIKSSFGTALQFFSFTQPIRYLLLYCLIGYIYFNYLA
ncbi:MAG: metal-dependent hydrolase [Legionellales bacterium]|nr:metal-dependent hydrolase [Legionellales bacterium]